MRNARKGSLCDLRTTQAQISLRISAGWSGPSLSVFRINRYCRICRRTENAKIRLHVCACWSGPTLTANWAFFVRWESYRLHGCTLEACQGQQFSYCLFLMNTNKKYKFHQYQYICFCMWNKGHFRKLWRIHLTVSSVSYESLQSHIIQENVKLFCLDDVWTMSDYFWENQHDAKAEKRLCNTIGQTCIPLASLDIMYLHVSP